MQDTLQAGLYLVAVPIGNLGDITFRALDVLKRADIVFCEDTRQTSKLFSLLNLPSKKLVFLNDHTESRRIDAVLDLLSQGLTVALVSDAGMPLISDPGFKLVSAVRFAGLYVTSIPGASSVPTAVQLSGIVPGAFLFYGFLPVKSSERKTVFSRLSNVSAALVFFEAPHRISETLSDMAEIFTGRRAALLRELTKKFEEVISFTFPDLPDVSSLKGEMVVVVEAPKDAPLDITAFLTDALSTLSLKEAVLETAEVSGRSRKEVYAEALRIQNETAKEKKFPDKRRKKGA